MRNMKLSLGLFLFLVLAFAAITLKSEMESAKNLGAVVNSKYSDFAPIVSADGKTLYFASDRQGGFGGQDGWGSHKTAGEWGEPFNLGKPYNTERNEGPDCFTPDEQIMYYTACNRPNGLGRCDIWTTYKTGDSWAPAKNLGSVINTKYNDANSSISPDNKTLYFVSDRPGGLGGWDIYYSEKKDDGTWGEPKNIGPTINTADNEIYVFIHWDGTTLYFSSDGRGGFGSADLFVSKKLGKNWSETGWSEPANLGPVVNSPEKDTYFSIPASGDFAYFSSTRSDTIGLEDIYTIPVPAIGKPLGLTLVYGIVADIKTCKKSSIDPNTKAKVYDITSCTPVEAVIRIADSKTDKEIMVVKAKPDGSYKAIINAGVDYTLSATAKNYSFHSERFQVPITAAYKEVEKNILLTTLEAGAVVVMHNIYFDFDKSTLRPESKVELNNLIRMLKGNPSMRLEIRGHTDIKGSDAYNIRLSKARAKAVVKYLVSKGGISAKRLTSVGYSFHMPIASNDTDEGRQMNRRVEFRIISK